MTQITRKRPEWMEADIEAIIADLEKERDSDVISTLHRMSYERLCDVVEAAWKEYSADYSAGWLIYKTGCDGYYRVLAAL